MIKKNSISGVFSTARIYCLISIVAAHLYFPGTFSTIVLSRLGTVGVVGFLVMAGYFYRPSKFGSFRNMLKKKAITIGLPWLSMGFLTWIYNAILNPSRRSVFALLKWILGNETFLYYMPVLVFCFIIFYKHNTATLSVAILLNVASILFTAAGFIKPFTDMIHITAYLNVFNWIGFFAFGLLLQKVEEQKLTLFLTKYRFLFVTFFAVCYFLSLVFEDVKLDYFSFLAIPYELVGVLAVFSISTFQLTDKKFFANLSASSFAIYLIHMIFIGLLDGYLARFVMLKLLSPLIVIVSVHTCLMAGLWLSRRINVDKLYCMFTGVRIK